MEQTILLTPGKLLREARLQAGLSQENVAGHLHLNINVVRDLEEDKYDRHNLVFMKGYLRACGKMLNIPQAELLTAFNNLNIEVKPAALDIAPTMSKQESQGTEVKVRKTTAIAAIILIIVVFLIWYAHHERDTDQSMATAASSEETAPAVSAATATQTEPPAAVVVPKPHHIPHTTPAAVPLVDQAPAALMQAPSAPAQEAVAPTPHVPAAGANSNPSVQAKPSVAASSPVASKPQVARSTVPGAATSAPTPGAAQSAAPTTAAPAAAQSGSSAKHADLKLNMDLG